MSFLDCDGENDSLNRCAAGEEREIAAAPEYQEPPFALIGLEAVPFSSANTNNAKDGTWTCSLESALLPANSESFNYAARRKARSAERASFRIVRRVDFK
jgi:hypothetical protein